MNNKDREKWVNDLDKILQDKAEKGFKQKLRSFFSNVFNLSFLNINKFVKDLVEGKPLINKLSVKQQKLKNIFDEYTIKTSQVTDSVSKKELKANLAEFLNKPKLKDYSKSVETSQSIKAIKPTSTVKPTDPKVELLPASKIPDIEDSKLKLERKKIREDIRKIINEKPTLITNAEKTYNKNLSSLELKDIQDNIRRDILEYLQENPSATVAQIKAKIKDVNKAFIDRRIEVIARTEGTKIANRRRIQQFSKSRVVQGVEFLAVMDNRTTKMICVPRHRQQFKLGSAELAMNTPPLHFNCRSILSPITIYEEFNPIDLETYNNLPPPQKGFNIPT